MLLRSLATLLLLACALALRAGELPRGSRDIEVALPVSSSGHRDQLFRRYAFVAWQRGDRDTARRHFEAAARHGDKPSQLALALLYLNGDGVPRDPARAYAYADLAAERGYPAYLLHRESIWAGLDEATRERAIAVGRVLYREYGDAVAKPRHALRLRQSLAGSMARHPSLRGHLIVTDVQRCRWQTVADACTSYDFFDDPAFDPGRYWQSQDRPWMHPEGVVDVGPLRKSRIIPD